MEFIIPANKRSLKHPICSIVAPSANRAYVESRPITVFNLRTPSTMDQPVARPLPLQDNTKAE